MEALEPLLFCVFSVSAPISFPLVLLMDKLLEGKPHERQAGIKVCGSFVGQAGTVTLDGGAPSERPSTLESGRWTLDTGGVSSQGLDTVRVGDPGHPRRQMGPLQTLRGFCTGSDTFQHSPCTPRSAPFIGTPFHCLRPGEPAELVRIVQTPASFLARVGATPEAWERKSHLSWTT